MKKHITLILTILLLLSSSFVAVSDNTKSATLSMIKEIDAIPCYLQSDISKEVTLEESSKMGMLSRDSYIIYDTEYDDFHPALAGDSRGRFVTCFELTIDGSDYYPDYWYSLDDGMSWDEAGYFCESLGSEYPDIDSNEYGFYSTFGGPMDIPGALWLVIAEDLEYITAKIWDWSTYGFNDFIHMSISCYTREDEPWNYGGIAGTGYNGYSGDVEGTPFIFYPYSEDGCIIDWLRNLEDCYHSDIAIDEVTEMSYAVYDNLIDANLIVRKDNFGVWNNNQHLFIGTWDVGDGVTHLWNPSIEAHDDAVVIVCEEKGDIVCFYSSNGFTSVQKSTVVTSAQYPEVKVTFDGSLFVCSYIKDDVLCRKCSMDGGATWEIEGKSGGDIVSEFGCHDLGRGKKGMYSVWEDKRGGDIDIYFGWNWEPCGLEITKISGGLGVEAEIFNGLDWDLFDVSWNIEVTGGLFGLIDRTKSGVIDTIPAYNRTTVRTFVVGLGRIEVLVWVSTPEGDSDTESDYGMIFGFYIFI